VDAAGEKIRAFNRKAQPHLQDRMKALKAKRGWSDADYEEQSLAYLGDARTMELDAKSSALFVKIDTLGRPDEEKPLDCAAIAEIEAAASEMLAILKAKSALR
jgi:hypothetical protein